MKRLTIVGSAILVVLIVGWIVYKSSRPKGFATPVPTSCSAPKTIKCPGPGDVDANGCPKGGYNASAGECVVKFAYYEEYAGCPEDHHLPMVFYTMPSPGNPSKYHLISASALGVQAAFTEIDCKSHAVVGPVNAGRPFLLTGDDFSDFKSEHISGDADLAAKDKCFKVTVNRWLFGPCIDPHIIVRGQ